MEKRGLILVGIAVVVGGFLIGALIPHFKQDVELGTLAEQSSYENEGWQLFNEGNYEESLKLFRKYIKNNPVNYPAYTGAGWSHFMLKQPDKAEEYFLSAIDIFPQGSTSYNGLGWIHIERNELEEAKRYFTLGLTAGPPSSEIDELYYGIGYSHLRSENLDDAVRYFRLALDVNPNDVYPYIGIITAYYAQGNYNRADEFLDVLNPWEGDPLGTIYYPKFEQCMDGGDFTSAQVTKCEKVLFIT